MTCLCSDSCAGRALAQAGKCLRGRVGRTWGKRGRESPATSGGIPGGVSTLCTILCTLPQPRLLLLPVSFFWEGVVSTLRSSAYPHGKSSGESAWDVGMSPVRGCSGVPAVTVVPPQHPWSTSARGEVWGLLTSREPSSLATRPMGASSCPSASPRWTGTHCRDGAASPTGSW